MTIEPIPGRHRREERPVLQSERVTLAAPMSLTGSAQRAWRLTGKPHGTGWNTAARFAAYAGIILLISTWWSVILCLYALVPLGGFLVLIPYRLIRRWQRSQKVAALRHQEMLTAIEHRQP
jgi:hypothetical protein